MGEHLGSLNAFLAVPVYDSQVSYGFKPLKSTRNTPSDLKINSKLSTRASSRRRNNSLRDQIDLSSRDYEDFPNGYSYRTYPKDIQSIINSNSCQKFPKKPKYKRPHSEIPDYSYIESRVQSFRNTEEYEVPLPMDIPLRDRVKNELLMRNYHHIIRAMRKTQKEDEENKIKESIVNNSVFDRLSHNYRHPTNIISPPRIRFKKDSDEITGVLYKKRVALCKNLAISVDKWKKKRFLITPEPNVKTRISKILKVW
ncbi:unnamed protein product [Blepharisma stoltei]|uniref:Uncharacterized protein n=1 Tax=Blepharisma stoltei TaxID=1481888 RepID=A0AAU9IGC7_9CILI|nr:unnamed protein product [Blepharisma stoltei]